MDDLTRKVSAAIMEARSSFFAEAARREGYTYCDWLAKAAIDAARHQGQDEAKAASVELIRDGDAVCTTCRWKGAHSPDCPLKDEPRPMIEVQAHQDPRERIAELEDVIEFTLESVYSVEHPKLPQAGCLGLGITSDAYCKLEAALQAKGAVS